MLILHIGLPKTASTFLQYRVFKRIDHYPYYHNSVSSPVEKALKRYVRVPEEELAAAEQRVRKHLPAGRVLISNENISLNGTDPWVGTGPTPRETARRLVRLATGAGGLRVLLGVRRQDTWLASRYAESAKLFSQFSQCDFEQRITTLDDDGRIGALSWLWFQETYQSFVDIIGTENVAVIPIEMIRDDLAETLCRLEAFLDTPGLVAASAAGSINLTPSNVLSTGPMQWELRGHETTLQLTEKLSHDILAHYGQTNQHFAKATGLQLARYGYIKA